MSNRHSRQNTGAGGDMLPSVSPLSNPGGFPYLDDSVASPKRVVMLGLGRLQLGLIGPTFRALHYELIAISLLDPRVVTALKNHHTYRLTTGGPHESVDIDVTKALFYDPSNLHSSETKCAIRLAAEAQVLNCGLGISDHTLDEVGRFLLEVQRFRRSHELKLPQAIISSDNPSGARFAIELIQKRLQALTVSLPANERTALWNHIAYYVRFLPTVVDRVCSHLYVPPDARGLLSVTAESFKSVILPRSHFGPCRSFVSDATRSDAIELWDDIDLARQRKTFILSLAHALAAYLGFIHPSTPRTIASALGCEDIRAHVEGTLVDMAKAFANNTGTAEKQWRDYCLSVLSRISRHGLADPIARVARDVPRKLGREDRLCGPLLFLMRTSFVLSESILLGIAAALCYAYSLGTSTSFDGNDVEKDLATARLGKRLRLVGIREAFISVSSLDPNDATEAYVADAVQKKVNELLPALGENSERRKEALRSLGRRSL